MTDHPLDVAIRHLEWYLDNQELVKNKITVNDQFRLRQAIILLKRIRED